MIEGGRHPLQFMKTVIIVLGLLLNGVHLQPHEKQLSPCELELMLKELVYPDEGYGLHASMLRSQLNNLLDSYSDNENNQFSEEDLTDEDKRSLSSLARNGLLSNNNGKRHIGSLAKINLLRQTAEDVKKSIATLAKNGQLPSKEPETDDTTASQWAMSKRNLAALARSGLISGKRNVASLARGSNPWLGKRNLASIVRGGMRPSVSPKRNLASLARGNMIPYFGEVKKNVGTLARDWTLPKLPSKMNSKRESYEIEDEKRNIGSFKNTQSSKSREKRSIGYDDYTNSNAEILEPVYQATPIDYEKYNEIINEMYPLYDSDIHDEKRFLGSLVRGGWSAYRPNGGKRNIGSLARMGLLRSEYGWNDNYRNQYRQREQKRHIGALARSGWLPAFRPVRGGRFSRSGRARSQIVEFFPLPERLRQPVGAVCERCRQSSTYPNAVSWSRTGSWITPPRLTALHHRSLRGPFHPTGHFY